MYSFNIFFFGWLLDLWRYLIDPSFLLWRDEHGDRPRTMPCVPELEAASDITERTESPHWDFDVSQCLYFSNLNLWNLSSVFSLVIFNLLLITRCWRLLKERRFKFFCYDEMFQENDNVWKWKKPQPMSRLSTKGNGRNVMRNASTNTEKFEWFGCPWMIPFRFLVASRCLLSLR